MDLEMVLMNTHFRPGARNRSTRRSWALSESIVNQANSREAHLLVSIFNVFAANVKAISIDARLGTVSYAARNLSFGLLGFPRLRFSGRCLIQTLPKHQVVADAVRQSHGARNGMHRIACL
jgi:hypothetical protein